MASFLPQFQIVEQSEAKLVCQKKPGIFSNLFIILFAIFFGGIPLAMLVLISSEYGVTQIACDRIAPQQMNCVVSQSQYLGFVQTIRDKPIEQITDVQLKSVEWSNDEGGGTRKGKVWVSLITLSGSDRLFETQYAIESGFDPVFQAEFIQQLKAFLNSQESSFNLERDTRLDGGFWGGVPLFGIYPLLALLVLYISMRSQTVILDKIDDRYIRHIRTILGTRTQINRISDIRAIEVSEFRRRQRRHYQLAIVLRSGKKYKFPSERNQQCVREIAQQFREFLGLG
ncbi:MAG: hypothetical protein SWY16_04260 [Cyanobacteriota bacterium]|nr:hypothetical protein [Cyanobacteriota bacterium]